jgi:hypothetical protein
MELARQAKLSYAAAHRELEDMSAAGCAQRERVGNQLVYKARRGHPQAALLRRLARIEAPDEAPAKDDESRAGLVRGWLRALGAPLGASPPQEPLPRAESVVAEGFSLAHSDSTVARVMPLVLWRQRDTLDLDELVREATRRDERAAAGFFLELTGRLGHDRRLTDVARPLRDRRRSRPKLFFGRPHGEFELALARRNTPALARKWGFLMNMGLDSFESTFTKHAGAA